jgi:hypothetical protein
VTALLVQDWLGGDLLRAVVEGVSHYWNRVEGVEIDLTREQFDRFQPVDIQLRSRDYVLSSPQTARRYKLLKSRVEAVLREECADESGAD